MGLLFFPFQIEKTKKKNVSDTPNIIILDCWSALIRKIK